MSYLLDTNVVSEFAAKQPHPSVVTWFREHQDEGLFLSVITIGEIQQGIERLQNSRKKSRLKSWLSESLLVAYADQILSIGSATMLQWGTLTARSIRRGNKMPVKDALIAATALQHEFTLVTRNVSDFTHTGLELINPWAP